MITTDLLIKAIQGHHARPSFSTFSHPEMRGEETTPLPLLLHQEIDEVKLRPRAREVNYEVWRIG